MLLSQAHRRGRRSGPAIWAGSPDAPVENFDGIERYSRVVTVKERLHRVIEEMSDEQAEMALRRLDALRNDPLLRFLDAAPLDDEPVAPDEQAAVAEAEADRAAGVAGIPFDEIKRQYG